MLLGSIWRQQGNIFIGYAYYLEIIHNALGNGALLENANRSFHLVSPYVVGFQYDYSNQAVLIACF